MSNGYPLNEVLRSYDIVGINTCCSSMSSKESLTIQSTLRGRHDVTTLKPLTFTLGIIVTVKIILYAAAKDCIFQ